jgi:hypothetical protein
MQSEAQRQAKKVFQNYFTSMLYDKEKIIIDKNDIYKYDVSTKMNEIIKSSCSNIWEKIVREYMTNELDPEKTSEDIIVSKEWSDYCRFFLKGGKSTLEYIQNIMKEYSKSDSVHKGNIAKAFYSQYITDSNDSDFDFCFVLNPDLMDNSNCMRHQRKIAKIIKEERHLLIDKSRDVLPLLLNHINRPYNQRTILSKLIRESINEFTDEERVIFNDFLLKCDGLDEPYFKFKLKEVSAVNFDKKGIEFIEKKVKLTTDTFYLSRLVIPFSFEDNFVFPTIGDKLFAECIDVSFSIDKEYSKKLWNKTDVNSLLRPLKFLDKKYSFTFPVIGIDYQLNKNSADTISSDCIGLVVILSEETPNKPIKRCRRFIEQLYFNCVEEKLPSLPKDIFIGKSVYTLMKEENECTLLDNIITFKKEVNDMYLFELKEEFMDLSKFEKWCMSSNVKGISLSWESQCNSDFIGKEELKTRIKLICKNDFSRIKINEEYLNKYSKSYLCYLYKNLLLISVVLDLIENRKSEYMDCFNNTWEVKRDEEVSFNIKNNLRDDVIYEVQRYMNKHYMDNYYKGEGIETLVNSISNKFLERKEPYLIEFANTLNKFTLK